MPLKACQKYFVQRGDDRELIPDPGMQVTATCIDDAVKQWAKATKHDVEGYLKKEKDRWSFWCVPIRVSKV